MIVSLHLKHAFNESDEGVAARWGETPTWQSFPAGCTLSIARSCDASTLIKFRKLLGEEGGRGVAGPDDQRGRRAQLIESRSCHG